MATFNLEPQYDSAKSFYGKARIETWGGWGQNANLYSYDTLVAQAGYIGSDITGEEYERFGIILWPAWDYSQTTLRHVKEFMQQNGFCRMSKREIIADAIDFNDYLVLILP